MDDLRNSSLNLEIVKLFVGQIPKDMDEDSLRVYFEEFGPLAELSIIRDSVNLGSKGCAFVTYRHAESAQCAVEKLHDKVKLPNSLNALQVRVAETQNERENKLFIGMLPKTVNEQDLHSMFVPYGELREVHIIRGPEGSPKGCAFVKYVDRDAAIAAIEDLNDSIPMGATRPLVVKFADSKKQGGKSKSDYGYDHHDNGGSYHMPMKSHQGGGDYWAGGSGSGHHQQSQQQQKMMYPFQQQAMMAGPYSQYGAQPHSQSQQQRYNMYVPNVGPSSNFYQQSGGGPAPAPYLVASPDYQQDMGGDRKFGKPQASFPHGDRDGAGNSTAYPPAVKPAAAPYSVVPPGQFDEGGDSQPLDSATDHEPHSRPPEGPSGANLFIYHLPRDLTDADLATLFAPFGNVISAKVFVDKKTSDSKGFGFVSYDVLDSANSAIDSMNGFQIGSKRLKVQHKRVMSGGGGMDDDSFGYSGGAGNDGRDSRGGGGYGQQQGSRRGGGGGGMNSLIGGMGAMNMGGYAPHDVGGGGGMDLYPPQGMRGGGGYNFPDYNKSQLQQQGIPVYRDGPGALQVDYQQQQLPAQQRYQQY